MRGRPPKPTEIRELEGNPGKRPLPEPVRIQGKAALEKPRGMPKAAQEAWDLIVPSLLEVGVVDGVDALALEAMCLAYWQMKEAEKLLKKDGILSTGSQGQLVEHPAAGTMRAASSLFAKYAEQYALTPVARTRLGLAELQRRSMREELSDRLGPRAREVA